MNDFELDVQNTDGRIDNGGNITLGVGGNISLSGALTATLDNTGGLIGSDTSLTIASSGALTAQGDATFQILNSDNGTGGSPGQISGSATIDVGTGGDFSANSLTALINDRHGGSIGSSAILRLAIGGALSIANDVFAGISTRNDGTGGGTIGSDATVNLSAGSISVGGAFTTFVSTNGGGSITGNALNLVNVSGDMIVQGPILVDIADTGFNEITIPIASPMGAAIYTNGQGTIGGNAIVNVIASQNISAPGTIFFTVANGNYQGFGPGTIGGDAQLNVTASNLSSGALFDDIYNYGGGSIGRDAIISLNLSNGFTATGDAELELWAATRHAAEFERLIGKPLRVEVSTSHAEHSHHPARVSREAVRRRGHRRLGQNHAARPAGQMADGGRPPSVRHRMELVRAGEGGHQSREEKERAHPDDVQSAPRHGLRRSPAV